MVSKRVTAIALIAAGIGCLSFIEDLSGVWVWLVLTLGLAAASGGALLLVAELAPVGSRWRAAAGNLVLVLVTTGLILSGLELVMQAYDALETGAPQDMAKPAARTEPATATGAQKQVEAVTAVAPVAPTPSPAAAPLAGAGPESVTEAAPPPGFTPTDPEVDPAVHQLIAARGKPLKMPESWKQRNVEIDGVHKAYYWHDVLHVRDENRFRRSSGFSAKQPQTFRIMVVGDSLTYGMGVAEEWIYSAVLERRLRREFDVEVLNLGINGWNSTAILDTVKTWLPRLQPDLVVYGVCLNDFLPTDVGQEVYATAYALPLPRKVARAFNERTHLGAFLSDRYDALLRQWDLRTDFYDGIFANLDQHRERFAADVQAMNAFVEAQGLPPVVGMVLHQVPRYQGRSHRLTRIAEAAMQDAGFSVVSTEDYYRRYDGRNFTVSTWEGHPNEEANQIFASMLAARISGQAALEEYRHPPAD